MKKYSFLIFLLLLALINACTEDTDGSPQIEAGDMNIVSIFPDSASGGELVTIKGTGLGDIRSIVLEKNEIEAGFQPTLNTKEVIMFRVPLDASGGSQNVILTNGDGRIANIALKVLAFPVVYSTSNYNYAEGTEVTITGLNLDDVDQVTLTESGEEISIVSASREELVLKFPATLTPRSSLDIRNSTGTLTTTQEFVNLDLAFVIFTDAYGAGFSDGSWGGSGVITDKEFKSGTKSVSKTYQKGNWHLTNFANWDKGVAYDADYKFLTVWIMGASQDYVLYLTGDKRAGGFGNGDRTYPLNVKAREWNYFKIPLEEVKLWEKGSPFNQIGFWIPGPDNQDETFYFDDFIITK